MRAKSFACELSGLVHSALSPSNRVSSPDQEKIFARKHPGVCFSAIWIEAMREAQRFVLTLDLCRHRPGGCGCVWRHEEALAEAPHAARQSRGLQGEAEGMPHSNVASGGVGGGSGGHEERG